MTYAKSTRVLLRMKPYLEILYTKRSEDDILFETGDPKNLAYRLREANKVLRDLDSHEFKPIVDKYLFKEQYPPHKMGVLVRVKVPEVRVSKLYNDVFDEIIRPEECSDIDIIGYMLGHKNINRVYFPNFNIEDNPGLVSIVNWSKFNLYDVESNLNENGVRIIKRK